MELNRREVMAGAAALAATTSVVTSLLPTPAMAKPNQWQVVKDALGATPGSDLEMLLENVKREHRGLPSNNAGLIKILLPVTVRLYHTMLTPKLVPMQVMDGPLTLIDDVPVRAKTRRLSVRWTFAPAVPEQVKERSDMDIEAEMMAALAQEAATEHSQEFLEFLRARALKIRPAARDLRSMITTAATHTLPRSNWAVVPASHLEEIGIRNVTERPAANIDGISVYADRYAQADTPILVGNNTQREIVWAPYVLLSTHGVIIDPNSFEAVMTFHTRYGLHETGRAEKQFAVFNI